MKVSFWLIPKPAPKKVLENIIADLAARFDAPIFEPHVTIYSGEIEDDETARQILFKTTGGVRLFPLDTVNIRFSDQFTKTLFVEFEANDELTQISEKIKTALRQPSGYVLQPHLSLLYATLPAAQKEALRQTLRVPGPFVWFDEIKAVQTSAAANKQDVEQWRTIASVGI